MRRIKYLIPLSFGLFIASCKKDNDTGSLASINIIQATINVPSVAVNFSDNAIPYYQNQNFIYYGSSLEYGIPSGSRPFAIVSSGDTSKTLLQGTFDLKPGSIYSFYLTGTIEHVDTLFTQDIIPNHSDNTAGLRVINLSPDSGPLSVNVSGAVDNDFNSLNYKNISAFKNYPVTTDIINNGGYNFEVKDASGTVLTTFNWSNPQANKNNTLVIHGSTNPNNSTPVGVFVVNNY